MDEFAARFMAFKGEDDYVPETTVLAEVTEVAGDCVEIAFNAPIPGKPRIYLSLSLCELVARAVTAHQDKK